MKNIVSAQVNPEEFSKILTLVENKVLPFEKAVCQVAVREKLEKEAQARVLAQSAPEPEPPTAKQEAQPSV